jgi:hypothetical protein
MSAARRGQYLSGGLLNATPVKDHVHTAWQATRVSWLVGGEGWLAILQMLSLTNPSSTINDAGRPVIAPTLESTKYDIP